MNQFEYLGVTISKKAAEDLEIEKEYLKEAKSWQHCIK